MSMFRARRWLLVIAGLVMVGVAFAVCIHMVNEDAKQYAMHPYGPDRMQAGGRGLVDQLNSGDPKNVTLFRRGLRIDDQEAPKYNAQVDRLVTSAMPLPGCKYVLVSVADRGEQGDVSINEQSVPTYRFDMNIAEHCPGGIQYDRLIGVIAIPSAGGHWEDAFFVIER